MPSALEHAQGSNRMYDSALSNERRGNILRDDEVRDHTNLHSHMLTGASCFWKNWVSPEKLTRF